MLHKFFEPGDWFAAKKLGYGAGLPIAWQGWALMAGYFVLMLGFGLLAETGHLANMIIGFTGIAIVTILFLIVVKKRTRGGWRWRP
ncbi:hypothetical protein [Erythrobacter sp. HKB08]|uniref:hypothetical protein n=1 Tax=Erythrobacter sp. HKB08 TaxID=2502843 RepID=UPI001008915F|nr:hypothetical protein [Erythrobacter sp. HKB08]